MDRIILLAIAREVYGEATTMNDELRVSVNGRAEAWWHVTENSEGTHYQLQEIDGGASAYIELQKRHTN